MEEHQNIMDIQDSQGDSGEGTAKVIKAGSEARAGRRVLRGATNGGNPAEASDHAAEAARSAVRAGPQAAEGGRVATYAAVDAGSSAEASNHAAEAVRNVVRASQQAVEGPRAATYAVAEESIGGGKVLDEWPSFIERALERNTQALSDLMDCYTLSSFLQWQSNLLSATVVDWVGTNARILRLVTYKA